MIGTILIILIICGISTILFFIIRRFSSVQTEHTEEEEEYSILDLNRVDPNQPKQEISSPIVHSQDIEEKPPISLKISDLLRNIIATIQTNIQSTRTLFKEHSQRSIERRRQRQEEQINAQKEKEASIQEESLISHVPSQEIDTSFLEEKPIQKNERPKEEIDLPPSEEHSIDQEYVKVQSFIEKMSSDDIEKDSSAYSEKSESISDTYYYTYMEKRYIQRIMKNPKDIEAYKKLGELYIETKNYPDALESFKVVMKLKPSDILAARRIKELALRIEKTSF